MSERAGRIEHLAAVLQHDDAVGVGEREGDVVQDEDQRLVLARTAGEDLGGLHPVERRDRLVADDDRPAIVERPRHRRALLLPAGQRARRGEQLVGEPDAVAARARSRRRRARRPQQGAQVVQTVERRSSRPM